MSVTIQGNKLIIEYPVRHEFEIVEQIESHYIVWTDEGEYVGLAERLEGVKYKINGDTLKAIKLIAEEAKLLARASFYGVKNLADAKKAIRSKRTSVNAERKRAYAKKALPILERITKA